MTYFQAASREVLRLYRATSRTDERAVASSANHITPRLLASTTRNMPAVKSGVSTKNSFTRPGVTAPRREVAAEIAPGVKRAAQRHDRDQQDHPGAEARRRGRTRSIRSRRAAARDRRPAAAGSGASVTAKGEYVQPAPSRGGTAAAGRAARAAGTNRMGASSVILSTGSACPTSIEAKRLADAIDQNAQHHHGDHDVEEDAQLDHQRHAVGASGRPRRA